MIAIELGPLAPEDFSKSRFRLFAKSFKR